MGLSDAERNALVEENIGLAERFARRYNASHMSHADLVQEASIGLINAAMTYDPTKGAKFSTWATYSMREAIMNAIQYRNDVVQTPKRKESLPCTSLDAVEGLAESVEDTAEPVEVGIDQRAVDAALHGALKHLTDREAAVIRCRYGLGMGPMKLRLVGAIFGVSSERIRQIQRRAEEKLREVARKCATLKEEGAGPDA